ncbi:MAG: hypothetical protein AAFO07_07840 [Bacteroidota bacterium]
MKSLGKIFSGLFAAALVFFLFTKSEGEMIISIIFACLSLAIVVLFIAHLFEGRYSTKSEPDASLPNTQETKEPLLENYNTSSDNDNIPITEEEEDTVAIGQIAFKLPTTQKNNEAKVDSYYNLNDCTNCGARLSGNLSLCNYCDNPMMLEDEKESIAV